MHKIKKIIPIIILALGLFLYPSVSFANAPGPVTRFDIDMNHLPADAAGVDFLLPRRLISSEMYADVKTDVLAEAGLSADCGLAEYDDGFVSCLAHYTDASYGLSLEWKDEERASAKIGGYFGGGQALFPVLSEMEELKLAVFDQNGAVLAVSDAFTTAPSFRYSFSGYLTYDVDSGHVDVNMQESYKFGMISTVWPFVMGLSVLITVAIEMLVGKAFSMQPLKTVACVTAITNLGMNALLYVMMAKIPQFTPATYLLYLEMAVVVIEFLIYRKKYPQHTTGHLIKFSVIANAASAVIGLAVSSGI